MAPRLGMSGASVTDGTASARTGLRLALPATSWITVAYLLPGVLVVIYSVLSPRVGGGVIWELDSSAWSTLVSKGSRSEFGLSTLGGAALRGTIAAALAWGLGHAWLRYAGGSHRLPVLAGAWTGGLWAANHLASAYNNFTAVFARSVVWSVWATVLCLVLALPLAVFIASRKNPIVKNALLVAVMIPFWTSMLVRTYAIRFLLANTGPLNDWLESLGFGRQVFLNTRFAVVLGLVYTALPFMILPLYAAVERSDLAQLEAARDLGAKPAQVFTQVFAPMISAGIVVGSTMVFVMSVSQYLVPTLLGGGKTNMVANLLELQFGESFNWPLGAALAVVFSALSIASLRLIARRGENGGLL
jgi:spermidine/putrescine transport system permease protein